MTTAITPQTVITRSEEAVSAEVDGTAVMMSVESGKYFGLDEIATRIWDLVENPLSFEAICTSLLTEYDIDEATCKQDVTDLLTHLQGENLVSFSQ
ncbi:lasso peptide biosynthesis PqqD family chaperone [Bacteroidota bacterium]